VLYESTPGVFDGLGLAQYGIRAVEGRAVWKLHVREHDPLVLVRHKPGRNRSGKPPREEHDHRKDAEAQDRLARQRASEADVAFGRDIEKPVEASEERAKRTTRRLWRFEQHRGKCGTE
jgi:hypothetical protein